MMRRGCVLLLAVVALAAARPAAALDVLMLSPRPGQPAFGLVHVEVEVLSAEPVAEVVFRVDDRVAARLAEPPWSVEIDVGQDNVGPPLRGRGARRRGRHRGRPDDERRGAHRRGDRPPAAAALRHRRELLGARPRPRSRRLPRLRRRQAAEDRHLRARRRPVDRPAAARHQRQHARRQAAHRHPGGGGLPLRAAPARRGAAHPGLRSPHPRLGVLELRRRDHLRAGLGERRRRHRPERPPLLRPAPARRPPGAAGGDRAVGRHRHRQPALRRRRALGGAAEPGDDLLDPPARPAHAGHLLVVVARPRGAGRRARDAGADGDRERRPGARDRRGRRGGDGLSRHPAGAAPAVRARLLPEPQPRRRQLARGQGRAVRPRACGRGTATSTTDRRRPPEPFG